MRAFVLHLVILCSAASAQQFDVVSAASGKPDLAPGALVSAVGLNLGTADGLTLQVTDNTGAVRSVKPVFASPTQVNFQIPADLAAGAATFQIAAGSSSLTSSAMLQTVAPALFTANESGAGVVAATAYRKVISTHFTSPVTLYDCPTGPGSCVPVPIDLGIDAPVFLDLYTTGIRGRSNDDALTVTVGGQDAPVQSIIPGDNGVDQVVVALPLTLRGAGPVDVVLTVDGQKSNAGQVSIL